MMPDAVHPHRRRHLQIPPLPIHRHKPSRRIMQPPDGPPHTHQRRVRPNLPRQRRIPSHPWQVAQRLRLPVHPQHPRRQLEPHPLQMPQQCHRVSSPLTPHHGLPPVARTTISRARPASEWFAPENKPRRRGLADDSPRILLTHWSPHAVGSNHSPPAPGNGNSATTAPSPSATATPSQSAFIGRSGDQPQRTPPAEPMRTDERAVVRPQPVDTPSIDGDTAPTTTITRSSVHLNGEPAAGDLLLPATPKLVARPPPLTAT